MDQKLAVPVKLVTDSFSDIITQMDSGAQWLQFFFPVNLFLPWRLSPIVQDDS